MPRPLPFTLEQARAHAKSVLASYAQRGREAGERYAGTNDSGNWRRWSDGQDATVPEWLANGPQHPLAVALMTERYRSKLHLRLHVRDVPCGVAGMDIVQHWCISNGRNRTPWRLSVFAAMEAVRLNNWTRRPLVPRSLV